MKTYTKDQFISYVCGWLEAEGVKNNQLTLNNMNAALLNASTMLKDSQDGISEYVARKEQSGWPFYRFEGKYIKQMPSDRPAFEEEALGYFDERDATVEKMINGKWCPSADPIYQPQYFRGQLNGGWITNNGLVDYDYC